jgi:hypothetical protein
VDDLMGLVQGETRSPLIMIARPSMLIDRSPA